MTFEEWYADHVKYMTLKDFKPWLYEAWLAAQKEALADQFRDTTKMVGCAYCDNPLFAGTKCNNCGRVTLAEPVKQEPVGWLMTNGEFTDNKWIAHGDGPDAFPVYAAPVDAKAIRAASEALQCAEARLEELGDYALVGKCAAAIRGLK